MGGFIALIIVLNASMTSFNELETETRYVKATQITEIVKSRMFITVNGHKYDACEIKIDNKLKSVFVFESCNTLVNQVNAALRVK